MANTERKGEKELKKKKVCGREDERTEWEDEGKKGEDAKVPLIISSSMHYFSCLACLLASLHVSPLCCQISAERDLLLHTTSSSAQAVALLW